MLPIEPPSRSRELVLGVVGLNKWYEYSDAIMAEGLQILNDPDQQRPWPHVVAHVTKRLDEYPETLPKALRPDEVCRWIHVAYIYSMQKHWLRAESIFQGRNILEFRDYQSQASNDALDLLRSGVCGILPTRHSEEVTSFLDQVWTMRRIAGFGSMPDLFAWVVLRLWDKADRDDL